MNTTPTPEAKMPKALRMALDLEALDLDNIAAELRRLHALSAAAPAANLGEMPGGHPALAPDMLVNGGALALAVNVLRRAGKDEVADELLATAVRADQAAAAPAAPADKALAGWQEHAVQMERDRDYWRQRAEMMRAHQEKECWYWQGDGHDHPESMVGSLQVVIRADQLRALMAEPQAQAGAESYPPLGRALSLGSAAPTLRAMASNYSSKHSWDRLDAAACASGAAEIEALRDHIASAAPQAQQPGADRTNDVLPLLIRDIAKDLGRPDMEVVRALKAMGHGDCSVNMAVTRGMAASLRRHFGDQAKQPDAAYAPLAEAELDAIYSHDREDGWCGHDVADAALRAIFARVFGMRAARAGAQAVPSAPAQTPRKPQLAETGVVPGEGLADWPAWCETFGERIAYQHGIADARAIAKLDTNKWREAVVRACMPTEACFDGSDPQKTLDNLIDWHVLNERQAAPAAPAELTDGQIAATAGRLGGISESRPLGQQWDSVYALVRKVIQERRAVAVAPAWADQAVIEYRYTGGTHWCPLGSAERMRPDFDGVYRLQAGRFPVTAPQDQQPGAAKVEPIDMVLHCPACGLQHIDAPEPELGPSVDGSGDMPIWSNPPHRSHLCHGCGHIWRPADVPTNGVAAVKTTGNADSPIAARSGAQTVPSDAEIDALLDAPATFDWYIADDKRTRMRLYTRLVLARWGAPAAVSAPSAEAAHEMGAKGGTAPEAERLAFEAWMRGHCWALSANWRGTQYKSNAEEDGDLDPRAMMTRRLWAAWRDRAALAAAPQVPAQEGGA